MNQTPTTLYALRVAVEALNAIPNRKLRIVDYPDSYSVVAMLDRVLRREWEMTATKETAP